MRFTVLYDACVLYPAPLRDFLMHLALTGLFAAKWSDDIHDEWITALLRTRPDLSNQLQRTRQLMNEAIPDSLVSGYQTLVLGLTLPDLDDRHVLAAAIRCNAQIIVTFNTKDFPAAILDQYGVEAMHPDIFVEHQLGQRSCRHHSRKTSPRYVAQSRKIGFRVSGYSRRTRFNDSRGAFAPFC